MNKIGEIIFDDDKNVIKMNGYDGNRNSFEFIELSEYYTKISIIQNEIHILEDCIAQIKKQLKDLV